MLKKLSFLGDLSIQHLLAGFIVFCASIILMNFLGFYWDTQAEPCLPYKLYLRYPAGKIEKGDGVVFTAQGNVFLGRNPGITAGKIVSGVPGDLIEISNGTLSINHHNELALNDHVLEVIGKTKEDFNLKYTLLDDEYFVTGTNPRSFDSRYWGPIKKEWIKSKMIGIL